MSTSIALGNQRLLQLAEILDTADERHRQRGEPTYHQTCYVHPCGTPSCAMGEWAAANPDRWILDVHKHRLLSRLSSDYLLAQCDEFGLSEAERAQLFGLDGCNNARTAKDAAAYIRWFVARRQS